MAAAGAEGGRRLAWLAAEVRARPWWITLLWAFCLYMTFIYLPYDMLFKSVAEAEEVWFGYVLRGWAARLTEPLHWLIYAGGAYGFLRMSRWMWPWASIYAAQVAIAMLVWNLVDARGGGIWFGLASAAVFSVPAVALWRARERFGGQRAGAAA